MSDVQVPEEKPIPLSAMAMSKIARELQLRSPDWNKIRMFLLQSNVDIVQGAKLVVPSNFPGVTGLQSNKPEWALLDPPTGRLRAVASLEPMAAPAPAPAPTPTPAPTAAPAAPAA